MSLWIRSQDKTELVKVEGIKYEKVPVGHSLLVPYEFGVFNVGQYESKERALEILNDIQAKLKNKYLAKVNPILNQNDFRKAVKDMEKFNNIDLIGSNSLIDIQPINPEVIIYEMPEK